MKNKKKLAIYLPIILVGVVWVIVDQVIMREGGPTQADGAISGVVSGDITSGGVDSSGTSPKLITSGLKTSGSAPGSRGEEKTLIRAVIAERLKVFAEDHELDLSDQETNPFKASDKWGGGNGNGKGGKADRKIAVKIKNFSLTGVMASDKGKVAIINGQCLSVGQFIDGFKVMEISDKAAVLGSDGRTVELELDQPARNINLSRVRPGR